MPHTDEIQTRQICHVSVGDSRIQKWADTRREKVGEGWWQLTKYGRHQGPTNHISHCRRAERLTLGSTWPTCWGCWAGERASPACRATGGNAPCWELVCTGKHTFYTSKRGGAGGCPRGVLMCTVIRQARACGAHRGRQK